LQVDESGEAGGSHLNASADQAPTVQRIAGAGGAIDKTAIVAGKFMQDVGFDIGFHRGTSDLAEKAGAQPGAAAQAVAIGEGKRHDAEPAIVDIARYVGKLGQRVEVIAETEVIFVPKLDAAAQGSCV